MWGEINSLLSLMIIICNVFVTPNLPSDLIDRIQFYPLYHLHENTTSQLHQKILLLMKCKCTGFSSKKAFSAKPVRQPTAKLPLCSDLPIYFNEVNAFFVLPFSIKKKKKKVNLRKRQVHKTALFPLLYLFMAHLLYHYVQNKGPKHFR